MSVKTKLNKNMKRIIIAITGLLLVGGLTSCKPKQSAYREAWEKAKQREMAQAGNQGAMDDIKPIARTTEHTAVVRERIVPAQGEDATGLRAFSVVIGSFQNVTNAKSLKERMTAEGYNVLLAQNEMGMYRVIVASYDTKEEAVATRESIKRRYSQFNDAWILHKQ